MTIGDALFCPLLIIAVVAAWVVVKWVCDQPWGGRK
jgi:hypothetical protein